MTSERAVPPFDQPTKIDGHAGPQGRRLLSAALPAMAGNVAVRTAVRVPEPRHGTGVSAAELLLNANTDRCYAVGLRVRTGVRYLTVTRHADGRAELLADDILAYDFDRWLPVEVTIVDGRITVGVDGRTAATVTDRLPLDGGGVGLAATATAAEFAPVEVVALGPRRPPAGRTVDAASPDLTAAAIEPAATVEGPGYRLDVAALRWAGGSGYAAELTARAGDGWVRASERFGERWLVLRGDAGSRRDPQGTLDRYPVNLTELEVLGADSVRLRGGHPELFALTVTWRLDGPHPYADIELTPRVDGRFVVAYQAFTAVPEDEVDEVLCGPLRHARMIGGPASVGRDELFAPMCLVQRGPVTTGLFAPAGELPFEYESARGDDDQPFGMGLRTPDGRVAPTLYAPQYGRRADLRAGETYRFTVGVYAGRTELYDAYRDLLRGEYGYTAYRRNVAGCSLTDTVHNLIDLLKAGPDTDDPVDYQGSPSGWWSRAKGFIDIENDQAVRATTTAVLLGAYQLTGDDELYETRALPTVEFHLSRNGYGWTPREDATVYGDPTKHALCGTPFGAPALAPLHTLTRGTLTAARQLALSSLDAQDYWLKRTPMSEPLAAYRMTRDPKLLRQAEEAAERYVAEDLDQPYGGEADPHDFALYYCRAWIELLEMFEETGRRRYLDAAYTEAKRFVTMVFARPVPDTTLTVPERPLFVDRQIELTGWWNPDDLYDYPATDVPDEQVPAWQVSPTGLSIEALNTYRFNGFTLNPGWAPFLLRLAAHTGDDLLRDVAHNALVGRFTNYPGYYYRQLTVHHLRPDFPWTGPFGNTTVYYHHAPAQLGMALDYLVTEHETRSGGAIAFPAEFEQNYVWFAFRVRGHAPGRFHGEDGVWLWLPKGLVRLDTEQVNWIAAEGGDRLCVSLTNAAATDTTVTVTLDPAWVPMTPGVAYRATVIRDGGVPERAEVVDHRLTVPVSGHGITAIVVHGLALDVPLHRAGAAPVGAHRFDDGPVGAVRGILIPKPDGSRYHAYVQAATREPATLHWSLDDGASWQRADRAVLPNEWTVPVDDLSAAFSYVVQVGDRRTEPVRLACGQEA